MRAVTVWNLVTPRIDLYKTLSLHYKDQPSNAVSGNKRCFFRELYEMFEKIICS
jgi:hypothetical protein